MNLRYYVHLVGFTEKKYTVIFFSVLFMSVISRILLLPRDVFSIFVNYKNFGNNIIAEYSKYAIQNLRNLTDFFSIM